MARLKAAQRRALPDSTFAGPGRSFPIPDKAHAHAALGLIGHAPPSARPKIRARAEAMLHHGEHMEHHREKHAHHADAMPDHHETHGRHPDQARHRRMHDVQVHGPSMAHHSELNPHEEDGHYHEHHELHEKAHPGEDGWHGRQGAKRHFAKSERSGQFT
jgi:hypothetical protein